MGVCSGGVFARADYPTTVYVVPDAAADLVPLIRIDHVHLVVGVDPEIVQQAG